MLAGPAPAKAFDPEQSCAGPQTTPKKAPKFEDFAAAPTPGKRPPLKLRSAEAKRFATQLRRGYQSGPPFAGAYRIAAWGCGAGCTAFAILDTRSGDVWIDEEVATVTDHAYNPFPRLTYRADSRLLMISGAPNEDDRREGVAFYDWTGDRLMLVKRYRYDQVCRTASPSRLAGRDRAN